jgi:tRNA nucleotidyltransferase (CCA-adding enzyme)
MVINLDPLYIVGGYVRDLVAGTTPKDMDLVTPLLPQDVMDRLNPHVIVEKTVNSVKFGTVFVNIGGVVHEITTFRQDMTSGRAPIVQFTDSLELDAQRRDFTINSLYLPYTSPFIENVIDPTGHGLDDIRSRVLRTVGDARDRFEEDPLRILRAIRFITRGYIPTFDLHEVLMDSSFTHRLLAQVSQERVTDEFLKILQSSPMIGLKKLKRYGLLHVILPEVQQMYMFSQMTKHHKHTLFNHSVIAAHHVHQHGGSVIETLVAFLHDIGKPQSMYLHGNYYEHAKIGADMVYTIFRRMKMAERDARLAKLLVLHHMRLHNSHSVKNLAVTAHLVGDAAPLLVRLYHADLWASRYELSQFTVDMFPTVPGKPVDGNVVKAMLPVGMPVQQIGVVMKKAWEIWYSKPDITSVEMEVRLRDFVLSLARRVVKC